MTCKTHEKIKDAIEEVRASLISALENKEEDIVKDLYEVYGKLRKISHSNISTGSTFMSYDGSTSFGSGGTSVTIDPSNHPDLCTIRSVLLVMILSNLDSVPVYKLST